MQEIEEVIFNTIKDNGGHRLTHCSMEDHPDIALAIMGEDLPPNYVGPPDLLGKFNVEIPSEAGEIGITIWFSTQEDNDKMSMIIQKFIEWRFPKLVITKDTTMGVYEPGKLTVKVD